MGKRADAEPKAWIWVYEAIMREGGEMICKVGGEFLRVFSAGYGGLCLERLLTCKKRAEEDVTDAARCRGGARKGPARVRALPGPQMRRDSQSPVRAIPGPQVRGTWAPILVGTRGPPHLGHLPDGSGSSQYQPFGLSKLTDVTTFRGIYRTRLSFASIT